VGLVMCRLFDNCVGVLVICVLVGKVNMGLAMCRLFDNCVGVLVICVLVGKVNMELQLEATITILLISKISSTCFGQTFAHLQERKT
jgi:hypothetical protein